MYSVSTTRFFILRFWLKLRKQPMMRIHCQSPYAKICIILSTTFVVRWQNSWMSSHSKYCPISNVTWSKLSNYCTMTKLEAYTNIFNLTGWMDSSLQDMNINRKCSRRSYGLCAMLHSLNCM